ncbi:MAG: sulfotransferase [Actinomycetota bacterium]|nr:sulfotransferase [Actinomycetota bacterium]
MFFIIGSARSGTTLLRTILNAHPEVAVPPESRFISELWRGEEEVQVDDFLQALAGHRLFRVWELDIERVRDECGDSPRARYADVIEAAYKAWAKSKGKTRWGDKTPRYIEQIPLLARLWPEAKFVHQIRDGRNVVLSYADVPFGPKTLGKAADLWRKRVSLGLATGRPLGAERYHEIRYEEFTADPTHQTKALCDFLEIEFHSDMLDYAEKARTDILPRAALYNPNVTKPPTKSLRAWENQMPDRRVEIFEAIAGDVLDMLEYPRRFPNPSPKAKVQGTLSRAGLPVARLTRRSS